MAVRRPRIIVASAPGSAAHEHLADAAKAVGREVQLVDIRDALEAQPGAQYSRSNTLQTKPLSELTPIAVRQALERHSRISGAPDVMFFDIPSYDEQGKSTLWPEALLCSLMQRPGVKFVPMGSEADLRDARSFGLDRVVVTVGRTEDDIVADMAQALGSLPVRDDTYVVQASSRLERDYSWAVSDVSAEAYSATVPSNVTAQYEGRSLETALTDALVLFNAAKDRSREGFVRDSDLLYSATLARISFLSDRLRDTGDVPGSLNRGELLGKLLSVCGAFTDEDADILRETPAYAGSASGVVALWGTNVALKNAWRSVVTAAQRLDPAAASGAAHAAGWDPAVLDYLQKSMSALCNATVTLARDNRGLAWSTKKLAHALRQKVDGLVMLDAGNRVYSTIDDAICSGELDEESLARVLSAGMSYKARELEGSVWGENMADLTKAAKEAMIHRERLVELYAGLRGSERNLRHSWSYAVAAISLAVLPLAVNIGRVQLGTAPNFKPDFGQYADPKTLLTIALEEAERKGMREVQIAAANNLFVAETWGTQRDRINCGDIRTAARRVDALEGTSFERIARAVYGGK